VEIGPTQAALRSLALADQQLITLCDLYGYSSSEAAIALGIPATAVRSRLSRARQRLARATTNGALMDGETI
jgi:RNA polymerase sigma-70 factor (ECF subfamily)